MHGPDPQIFERLSLPSAASFATAATDLLMLTGSARMTGDTEALYGGALLGMPV